MSAEVAARLRSLAQDHHDGRLDLTAYRALRAPLLDSLSTQGPAGMAPDTTQPRDVARQELRDAITRPGRPRVVPRASVASEGPAVSTRRLRQLAVVLAVAIVVVAVAGVSLWIERRPARPAASAAVVPATGVKSLLDDFAANGDWSDARVTTLNAALLELGGGQIIAAAHDEGFQRFVDELRRRLKEQQALSPTRMTADNSPLAALAVTVGIDLNSPDAALHIAPLPPPVALPAPQAPQTKVATIQHPESHVPQPAHVGVEAPAAAVATPAPPVADTPAVTAPDACRSELLGTRRPLCHDALPGGVNGPELVLVPAGNGATAFAVSVYEISPEEFKQFCESTHRACSGQRQANDTGPGVNVSWAEAHAYAEWLTSVTHRHYSLPTTAQWDYASHAAFRLLHTVGNVREWALDAPGARDETTGFRMVRDLP